MDTRLKADLEKAISDWVERNCETGEWPDRYFYNDQHVDMAEAAARVFDASVKGQEFAENE